MRPVPERVAVLLLAGAAVNLLRGVAGIATIDGAVLATAGWLLGDGTMLTDGVWIAALGYGVLIAPSLSIPTDWKRRVLCERLGMHRGSAETIGLYTYIRCRRCGQLRNPIRRELIATIEADEDA